MLLLRRQEQQRSVLLVRARRPAPVLLIISDIDVLPSERMPYECTLITVRGRWHGTLPV